MLAEGEIVERLMSALEKLATQAGYLDSQLVTRDDGRLESMYAYEAQKAQNDMYSAMLDAYGLLEEIRSEQTEAARAEVEAK